MRNNQRKRFKFLENDPSWHSRPLSQELKLKGYKILGLKNENRFSKIAMRDVFISSLEKLAKKKENHSNC